MEKQDNTIFWIIGGAIACILIPPIGALVIGVVVWLLISSFFTDQNKED